MNFETCVLAAATADLDDEPAAREHADAAEFRLDLTARPLDSLADYDGDLPVIATNRLAAEGGDADDENRLGVLSRAVEYPNVEAVDIEFSAIDDATELIECARENDVTIIVSSHDFTGTPSCAAMRELLERAGEYGDVAKFAVTAENRADVLSLLSVTHELDSVGQRVATMAMGEVGRHSRALAPLYGSRIAYAPVDPAAATAPGQYDLATLAGLLDTL